MPVAGGWPGLGVPWQFPGVNFWQGGHPQAPPVPRAGAVGGAVPVPPGPGGFPAPGLGFAPAAGVAPEHCWAASASRITVLGEVRVVSAYQQRSLIGVGLRHPSSLRSRLGTHRLSPVPTRSSSFGFRVSAHHERHVGVLGGGGAPWACAKLGGVRMCSTAPCLFAAQRGCSLRVPSLLPLSATTSASCVTLGGTRRDQLCEPRVLVWSTGPQRSRTCWVSSPEVRAYRYGSVRASRV